MKKLIMVFIAIVFTSCTLFQRATIPVPCNENLVFKRDFFYNVWVIEKYTIEHEQPITYSKLVSSEEFLKCYEYLNKVTNMPGGNVFNYQVGYVSYQAFKLDKKKWLEWYAKNKCSYID